MGIRYNMNIVDYNDYAIGNIIDILIYSLLKNLSDTIGLKEDSYKSIVISNVEIGNILNVSKDTAKRTLNKLVELNLIKIEYEGYSNRRIIYIPIEDK